MLVIFKRNAPIVVCCESKLTLLRLSDFFHKCVRFFSPIFVYADGGTLEVAFSFVRRMGILGRFYLN